jgi:hypothetical protein
MYLLFYFNQPEYRMIIKRFLFNNYNQETLFFFIFSSFCFCVEKDGTIILLFLYPILALSTIEKVFFPYNLF